MSHSSGAPVTRLKSPNAPFTSGVQHFQFPPINSTIKTAVSSAGSASIATSMPQQPQPKGIAQILEGKFSHIAQLWLFIYLFVYFNYCSLTSIYANISDKKNGKWKGRGKGKWERRWQREQHTHGKLIIFSTRFDSYEKDNARTVSINVSVCSSGKYYI